MGRFQRIFTWALMVGAICFAIGFFGPLIWAPDANQGPLLGIFITGPLGFVAGLVIGVVREMMSAGRPAVAAASSSATTGAPSSSHISFDQLVALPIARTILGLGSIFLIGQGAASLGEGGRGPGAAIAVGLVAGWIAATGRIPGWFRRR